MPIKRKTREFINFLQRNDDNHVGTTELIDQLKLFLSQNGEYSFRIRDEYSVIEDGLCFSYWYEICGKNISFYSSILKTMELNPTIIKRPVYDTIWLVCQIMSYSIIPNKAKYILDYFSCIKLEDQCYNVSTDIGQEIIALLKLFIEKAEPSMLDTATFEKDDSLFYAATQLADSLSIDKNFYLTRTFRSCLCSIRGGPSTLCRMIFKDFLRWSPIFFYRKLNIDVENLDIVAIEYMLKQNFLNVEKIDNHKFRDCEGNIIKIIKSVRSKLQQD